MLSTVISFLLKIYICIFIFIFLVFCTFSFFTYTKNYLVSIFFINFRYVEWSRHEPEPGIYDFDGNNDLPKFLETAKDLNMLVILRTGPFIDAERDMVIFVIVMYVYV